ncbi:MAG TPA: FHA domain-containing protein [Gemmataceae bacterium]|nr:FHA domain-containing protein [Gemmataceae bacterium]
MDNAWKPDEAVGLPAPRLHNVEESEDLPAGFVPLKLLLQPGGLCVELNRPDMLVGRHSEVDVRLAMPDVSRRHCRFHFTSGAWRVIDLNSLNGVYVNDVRLEEAVLTHGDRVRIASLTFLVDLGGENPGQTVTGRPSVLKSIADVLPDADQEKRKAS